MKSVMTAARITTFRVVWSDSRSTSRTAAVLHTMTTLESSMNWSYRGASSSSSSRLAFCASYSSCSSSSC